MTKKGVKIESSGLTSLWLPNTWAVMLNIETTQNRLKRDRNGSAVAVKKIEGCSRGELYPLTSCKICPFCSCWHIILIMLHYLLTFMHAESLASLHTLKLYMAWEAALVCLGGCHFIILAPAPEPACEQIPPSLVCLFLCCLSMWSFHLLRQSDMYRNNTWLNPSWLFLSFTGLDFRRLGIQSVLCHRLVIQSSSCPFFTGCSSVNKWRFCELWLIELGLHRASTACLVLHLI